MLRALHLINLPYEGIWLDQLEFLARPVGSTGLLDRVAQKLELYAPAAHKLHLEALKFLSSHA